MQAQKQTTPVMKQTCNCSKISHSHFKPQCIKIERAQQAAERAQREAKKVARSAAYRSAVASEEPAKLVAPTRRPNADEKKSDLEIREQLLKTGSKVETKKVVEETKQVETKQVVKAREPSTREKTEEELRRERGAAAWAKSCPGSELQVGKDSFKVTSKEKTGKACNFSDTASTAASESDMSSRNFIIVRMGLADKQEKDLRKTLRTLYEIRVAEQTIILAEKEGKKSHPNLVANVGRKASLTADPLVQRFRGAGGSI
jgi:hypothetical protein